MEDYIFECDPIANAASVVKGSQYRFTLINSKVIRYEWAEDGVFEDRASTFAINRNFPSPEFRVDESEFELNIITPFLQLSYDKKRFSSNGLVVKFVSKMNDWGSEWRYGETLTGNLGGTARTLDMVDGRCDMGYGIISRDGYSALDDSTSMLFDGHGFVAPRQIGDRIDGYLFHYAWDFTGAMESFYAISGNQPSVPRWCLGNWWSRYHAYTQDEYMDLMENFKSHGTPMSVAVIDIDWHWIKEDFVPHSGWTGYTWNSKLFPDHIKFAQDLHNHGLKITLNDHPHLGIAHHEEVYEELARILGHDTTHRDPIQFDPSSPKFLHAFFNVVHRRLENQGCDFWWIDWQQGSQSRTPGFDPLWLLNHFQFLDTKQTHPETESVIFSRYAGPGSHRYPVGFSGDTLATWNSLKFQPEFTATASNIGYGWWSHDIGGHLPGYRDDECATRWVQYGVFSPVFRLHSTLSRWMSKEPWLYRQECDSAITDAMRLRHRLVPYVYAAAIAQSPLPLVQPLYWKYPKRAEAYRYANQYYFGPSLVVAPVVNPRNRITNLATTKAWIPPQRHVDIFTGSIYDGDRDINLYRPLDSIPVLAHEGSIIPLDSKKIPHNGCKNPDEFEVIVVVGQSGQFDIVEDERDDVSGEAATKGLRKIVIRFDQDAGRLDAEISNKRWRFRFLSTRIDLLAIKVRIDDSVTQHFSCYYDHSTHITSTIVEFLAERSSGKSLSIDLGPNPQLDVLDHSAKLNDILRDFQIDFYLKDKIWEIIESSQPINIKASRLLTLGLEEDFYGPVAELLFADSRG